MASAENLEPGLRFGHYELRERMGQDAFCTAWQAVNVVRKFPVQLRIVRGYLARPTAPPAVNLLTTFMHPNLLEVLEVCANIAIPHVVYRPVSGERLDEALVRGPLPWQRVAAIADGLLAGLEALHGSGNCIGRLSPDLVILSDDGRPRLDGLGVQRLVSDEYQALLSAQDPLASTGHYLTPQGDLWSLGALTWCALTARMPPLEGVPPLRDLVPGLPSGMAHFVTRCLGEGEAGPYADAREAARDLVSMLAPPEPLVFAAGVQPPDEATSLPVEVAAEGLDDPPAPGPELAPVVAEAPPEAPIAARPVQAPEPLAADLISADALRSLEARLAAVREEMVRRQSRWPQGEAEAAALMETIGHAHLRTLEGALAPATVRRHGRRLAVQGMAIPLGMVLVMALMARQVFEVLEASALLSVAAKCALGAAVFGATALVAAWLIVNLGLQRLVSRSSVEVTLDEIIVRRLDRGDVTDRIPARLLARVEVLKPPAPEAGAAVYRLVTRAGPHYTIRFDAAPSPAGRKG